MPMRVLENVGDGLLVDQVRGNALERHLPVGCSDSTTPTSPRHLGCSPERRRPPTLVVARGEGYRRAGEVERRRRLVVGAAGRPMDPLRGDQGGSTMRRLVVTCVAAAVATSMIGVAPAWAAGGGRSINTFPVSFV